MNDPEGPSQAYCLKGVGGGSDNRRYLKRKVDTDKKGGKESGRSDVLKWAKFIYIKYVSLCVCVRACVRISSGVGRAGGPGHQSDMHFGVGNPIKTSIEYTHVNEVAWCIYLIKVLARCI